MAGLLRAFVLALILLILFASILPPTILYFYSHMEEYGYGLFSSKHRTTHPCTVAWRCVRAKIMARSFVGLLVGRGRFDVGVPKTDSKTEINYRISRESNL